MVDDGLEARLPSIVLLLSSGDDAVEYPGAGALAGDADDGAGFAVGQGCLRVLGNSRNGREDVEDPIGALAQAGRPGVGDLVDRVDAGLSPGHRGTGPVGESVTDDDAHVASHQAAQFGSECAARVGDGR